MEDWLKEHMAKVDGRMEKGKPQCRYGEDGLPEFTGTGNKKNSVSFYIT